MNNDEISARLIVLETFAMSALGLYLANSRNDPDYSKAAALIDYLKQSAISNSAATDPSVQNATQQYAEHLTSILMNSIRNLRGEDSRSH